jgi:hypothetical protein
MSAAADALETGTEDVAKSGIKAGEKLGTEFGEHIPAELENSSALVQDGETETKNALAQIGESGVRDAGHDAGPAAEDLTSDASRAGTGEANDAEQEATEEAHRDGESGATDDPVDVVTGEMFLPQQDLTLPGVLPLVLNRRHGSAFRHGRFFGTTWSSTLDQRVEVAEQEIRLLIEDGRIHRRWERRTRPALPWPALAPDLGPRRRRHHRRAGRPRPVPALPGRARPGRQPPAGRDHGPGR